MPRELRPRKPRPSYANLERADHGDAGGPSNIHLLDEEDDSGCEFEPNKHSKKVPSEENEDADMDDDQDPESEVEETPKKQGRKTASSSRTRTSNLKRRAPITGGTTDPGSSLISSKIQKRKLPPKVQQATRPPSVSTPPLAAPRAAKMYALPNPSAHHRHRAIPVFFRKDMVERLNDPPSLFKEPCIVPTNSMTASQSLTERVSKAWGFNVGAGPVWQIMEDRSCYKESISSGPGSEQESSRRPRVYQNVSVRPDWELLSNQCVAND